VNRLSWLIRREFWENKGGILWAPVWTAGVFLALSIMGAITAEVFKTKFSGGLNIGVSIRDLTTKITPEQLATVGPAIDVAMLGLAGILSAVLGFVLFFYLLGALYDDRRDRSVLFWKSLPLSDRDTVLSKVLVAAVLAPLISVVVSIALHIGVLSLMSVHVMFYGVNPITVLWGPAEPVAIWLRLLASIPLNALWALPCMGWLLLVSSFARSKPFLWAVLLPVGLGLMVNWFDVLSTFSVPDTAYWMHVALRILAGVFPGSYQFQFPATEIAPGVQMMGVNGATSWANMGQVLFSAPMWIGAVAGVVMLYGAMYMRRWRDEA
jgi:ABC-2 type transport system permease protein